MPPSLEPSLTERLLYGLAPGRLLWRRRATKAWRKERNVHLRALEAFVDPTRASVDVGANRGVFTYHLARLTREVHAYEPHPRMAWLLGKIARAENVHVHPVALSDARGRATLSIPWRADGGVSSQRSIRSRIWGHSESMIAYQAVSRLRPLAMT